MERLVFVYGTLRKGCANHHHLARGARFLGAGRAEAAFALYLDADGVPYAARDAAIAPLRGELYRVDEATLAALDALEGHPDDYRRVIASVLLDDGARREAWLYIHPRPPGRLLPGGDFLAP